MSAVYRVYREVKDEVMWFADTVWKVKKVDEEAFKYLQEVLGLGEEAYKELQRRLKFVNDLCVSRSVKDYMYLMYPPDNPASPSLRVMKVLVDEVEVCGHSPQAVFLKCRGGYGYYLRVDLVLNLIMLSKFLKIVKDLYSEFLSKAEEVGKHNKEQYLMVKLMYS